MNKLLAGIGIAFESIQVFLLLAILFSFVDWSFITLKGILIALWAVMNVLSILAIYFGLKK